MNIQGPWYSKIGVSEKVDGLPAAFSIVDKGTSIESLEVRAIEGPQEFRNWAGTNRRDLIKLLSEGIYRGVWWGNGIGRGYGQDEQFFSFLDYAGYDESAPTARDDRVDGLLHVPVLYMGPLAPENGQDPVAEVLRRLQFAGSALVPGFKKPAGVVVTNLESGLHFDVELE